MTARGTSSTDLDPAAVHASGALRVHRHTTARRQGHVARVGAARHQPTRSLVRRHPRRVEPTRSGRVSASRAWLGGKTWPAWSAAGITAAYGALKAYWVFGGTALWSIAPLSQDMIDKARSHTAPTWFVIADAATVVLAAGGVWLALATLHPRRWLPVSLVRRSLWPLAALMVLRAVLAIVGDVYQFATGAWTRTTLWDLVLWSPWFLIWGLLWAATAVTYAGRVAAAAVADHEVAESLAAGTPGRRD
jgi:hypothetical protein